MGISDRSKTTVDIADVPTTTDDMTALMEWEHGDTVRGNQAKAHPGMNNYRNDINKGYGKEGTAKTVYIDTFKPVGKQLDEIK